MKCPLVRKLAVCLRSLWSGIPASPHPPAVFNTFRFSFVFSGTTILYMQFITFS